MKNLTKIKILAFSLALMLIMPCAFIFAGCGESVARVSTFDELVEAIEGNYDIVQLQDDIDVSQQIAISKKISLDLNGKKLYNTKDLWSTQENNKVWSLISVKEGGDLTIYGNGKMIAKENDCYALDVVGGGNLTVENGEFVGNISTVYCFEGNANIKGGKFSILQTSDEFGSRLTMNLYDANRRAGTANMKIYGGTYVNFNPADPMEEGYKLLGEGYVSNLVEGSKTDYVVTLAA